MSQEAMSSPCMLATLRPPVRESNGGADLDVAGRHRTHRRLPGFSARSGRRVPGHQEPGLGAQSWIDPNATFPTVTLFLLRQSRCLCDVTRVLGRQRVAQVLGQGPHSGDVLGVDAYSGFVLDARAQFEVAQRVEAVLGERTVRIDGATQNQADLLGDQTPKPGEATRPAGSSLSSARNLLLSAPALPRGLEHLGEPAALRQRSQPRRTDDRRIAGVGAVVAQQRLERVGALVGSDHRGRSLSASAVARPISAQAPHAIAVAGRP